MPSLDGKEDKPKTIACRVEEYVKVNPIILACLKKGYGHVRTIAKDISRELNIGSTKAIEAKLHRLKEELVRERKKRMIKERQILEILARSAFLMLRGMRIVESRIPLEIEAEYSLALDNMYVYLVSNAKKIPKEEKSKSLKCSVFAIESDKRLRMTPGVVAYLTDLLWNHSINMLEFVSASTETIIVVSIEDEKKTYELLAGIIPPPPWAF